jgi:hypothetical protein
MLNSEASNPSLPPATQRDKVIIDKLLNYVF